MKELFKKVWDFISHNKDIGYVAAIIMFLSLSISGWNRYWEAQETITAYKEKNETLEKRVALLDKSLIERTTTIIYNNEGKPVKEEKSETIKKDVSEKTDVKENREVQLPDQHKYLLAGVGYTVAEGNPHVALGVNLPIGFSFVATHPVNFDRFNVGIWIYYNF